VARVTQGDVVRADGHVVRYADLGDAGGRPVVYCHGAPGSRLDLAAMDADIAASNVRVVAIDRPGYGGSTPRPGRGWTDGVDDVLAVAEHLGLARFAVAGYSSGGPHAVGTAAVLGPRVTRLAVVAGVTDLGWDGATAGYVHDDLATLMAIDDPDAAVAWCEARYGTDGSGMVGAMGELAPPDMRALADPALLQGLLTSMSEAFAQGMVGYAHDMQAEARPWSFDPGTIAAPCTVYHGEQDTIVPVTHARHTAERIPRARLVTWTDDGHLSVQRHLPAVLADLTA
jgi:pimeloyl-ACP methyl ester carboxylesterase